MARLHWHSISLVYSATFIPPLNCEAEHSDLLYANNGEAVLFNVVINFCVSYSGKKNPSFHGAIS